MADRRKITYHQFEEALKMMAEKKYPGDEGGLDKLKALISEAKGPELHGATVRVLCCYMCIRLEDLLGVGVIYK